MISIQRLKLCGLLFTLFCAGAAQAQTVTVRDAWIRGTVQGQSATGAFMELTAKAHARLVAASSPVAGVAEVHNMRMENGVMRMFPVAGIDIPAGRSVKLASGGYHVMLMQLQKPLNAGDKVPLSLTFELADKKRETVELSVEVRDVRGQPVKSHHGH
ncbi:MAG: copper chaperone PCu(A)C [Burkholderiales bacterium]|jgi:copper(I)-binding protein|nr:copper chaperone PCu(A)C [Burkholderiales bacterium]